MASQTNSFVCVDARDMAADGHTYERVQIEEWIRREGDKVKSPTTNETCTHPADSHLRAPSKHRRDHRKRHARAAPSAACDVARRLPPHAIAADRECMADTWVSQKRFGDWLLDAERIQVYTLIKEHEPENLKTEVTEPQQKEAQEALTSGNRLTSARFCTL